MLSEKETRRLSAVFEKYPDIAAVYLFGSNVSGKLHSESDLDLAVYPKNDRARQHKLDILADITRAGFDDVDLVFLDTDDIVLNYEAVKNNLVIFQVDDFDRGTVFSKIVRQYLDFQPYLKVQREAYKRRLLRDEERNHPKASE